MDAGEVKRLALEAGFRKDDSGFYHWSNPAEVDIFHRLGVFAALVAEAEREKWEKQTAVEINEAGMFPKTLSGTPQREWVGLTAEEVEEMLNVNFDYASQQVFAQAIEAKLKEKNHG